MTKIIILFFPLLIFSYGDEDDGWETVSDKVPEKTLTKINFQYLERIKPIFERKCLDCHGIGNTLPWYSNIPGVKQLIKDDIKEAVKHMDMRGDFPFIGHGSPEDDLEALSKTIKNGSMPPLRYKLINWNSFLNKKEKETIQEWIKDSLMLINLKQEEK